MEELQKKLLRFLGHQEAARLSELHGISVWKLKNLLSFRKDRNNLSHGNLEWDSKEEASAGLNKLKQELMDASSTMVRFKEDIEFCLGIWSCEFWDLDLSKL